MESVRNNVKVMWKPNKHQNTTIRPHQNRNWWWSQWLCVASIPAGLIMKLRMLSTHPKAWFPYLHKKCTHLNDSCFSSTSKPLPSCKKNRLFVSFDGLLPQINSASCRLLIYCFSHSPLSKTFVANSNSSCLTSSPILALSCCKKYKSALFIACTAHEPADDFLKEDTSIPHRT